MNWRGKPLINHEVMVELIGATTNRSGLKVQASIDRAQYPTGRKISKDQIAAVCLEREVFHGDWNYQILPHNYHTD